MSKPPTAKLPWLLAGAYLAWSCLVYFGSLGSESHSWWPLFLFPLILPWSAVHQFLLSPVIERVIVPNPRAASASAWMTLDYIAGGYYIVVGTIWKWFLGKWLVILYHRYSCRQKEPD